MRQRRLFTSLLIATIIVGLVATAGAASAAGYTVDSGKEQEFLGLINEERTSRGLSALAFETDLRDVARAHSREMAEHGSIYHNDNLANEVEGNWTILGENVGMGGTVASLHDAFMNSQAHRANILKDDFNEVGLGVVLDGDGYIFVTQVFAHRTDGSTGDDRQPSTSPSSSPKPRPKATSSPSSSGGSGGSSSAAPPPAPAPAPPAPAPEPEEEPRTVDVLVRLLGLDAQGLDPVTGQALGA